MKTKESHGDYGERLYHIYYNMRQRCYWKPFKQYKDYGGRGITVCNEWLESYVAFRKWALANGYSKELTIDRRDNDKGYFPENCQWKTHSEQKLNTRKRSDNTSGYKGVSLRKDTGKYDTYLNWLGKRIRLGSYVTAEEAVIVRNNYILKHSFGHGVQEVKIC